MMTIETRQIRKEAASTSADEERAPQQVTLALEGMTCASCAMRIEKGLKKVPGVQEANVNLANERATVTYDPTQTDLAQLIQKVETVGYGATPHAEALTPSSFMQPERDTTGAPVGPALPVLEPADEQSKRRQTEHAEYMQVEKKACLL